MVDYYVGDGYSLAEEGDPKTLLDFLIFGPSVLFYLSSWWENGQWIQCGHFFIIQGTVLLHSKFTPKPPKNMNHKITWYIYWGSQTSPLLLHMGDIF